MRLAEYTEYMPACGCIQLPILLYCYTANTSSNHHLFSVQIKGGRMVEVVPIPRWLWERKVYHQLITIPYFANYKCVHV